MAIEIVKMMPVQEALYIKCDFCSVFCSNTRVLKVEFLNVTEGIPGGIAGHRVICESASECGPVEINL